MRIPIAHIEPDLKATEQFGAIRELLDRLVHAGAVPRAAENAVFQALSARETTMSTGIGCGLAIPHAESAELSEPVVAFGRSRAGIQFNSLDGVPVEFVLLFVVPPARSSDEQRFRFLSKGLRRGGSRKSLRDCSTAQEIGEILNDDFSE